MNEQGMLAVGAGTLVLPVPPIISQSHSVLPDGFIDPQGFNDCGEACVSSVVVGMRGLYISPGCWRAALGGPDRTGLTTGKDLCTLLQGASINARALEIGRTNVWERLHHLRRTGSYAIMLGNWLSPQTLHWYLAYEGDGELVWCMDPWTATYVPVTQNRVNEQFGSQIVEVHA